MDQFDPWQVVPRQVFTPCSGLPRSGKITWKMKFFPGQGILWMVGEI